MFGEELGFALIGHAGDSAFIFFTEFSIFNIS